MKVFNIIQQKYKKFKHLLTFQQVCVIFSVIQTDRQAFFVRERFETFTVLINRISRNIRKIKNQEMAEYNLRSSHISCLYYLYNGKSVTATDLCERCEEDKATISRSLEYLEKNGYLICKSKFIKRYKTPLELTEKGAEIAKKISYKIDNVLDKISYVLTEEERINFYRSLANISQCLELVSKRSQMNGEKI